MKNKPSAKIKWKVFLAMLGFSAILLLLLWVLQILFLDQFYQAIKSRTIRQMGDYIAEDLAAGEDYATALEEFSRRTDLAVRILSREGEEYYTGGALHGSIIAAMDQADIQRCYDLAKENHGEALEMYLKEDLLSRSGVSSRIPPRSFSVKHMVLAQIAHLSDGSEVLLLISAPVTPVQSTVSTLQVQMVYITVIMLALSLAISFVLARKIARPLVRMGESARQLARGNYQIRFEGHGYLESEQLSQTLNYAAGELSKTDALRRELIANISHDLRTPLTMIIGYSEMMRDIPGENSPENIQTVIDEARRLSSLVSDIMDLSKFESGVQPAREERLNLTHLIREILTRYNKLVEQDGFHIRLEAGEDLWVTGDQTRLSQVIYNLVNNAVNYTGEDKLVTVRQTRQGSQVLVEVIDTGEGIPADQLPLIWERYYRVDKTHKRAAIGSGLGLSIVRSILEQRGVEYGAKSEEGKGSTFYFLLPVTEPPAP